MTCLLSKEPCKWRCCYLIFQVLPFITNLNKMKLAHGRNLIIWLSFYRAGILVILCHIFRCASISQDHIGEYVIELLQIASIQGRHCSRLSQLFQSIQLSSDKSVERSIRSGVEPSPCFSNFLARTNFVLESLPEAKNPGQDAFWGILS